MTDGVNVTASEWSDWAKYFARTFPGAPEKFIEQMTHRMIRTLSFCGVPKRMTRSDFNARCADVSKALSDLPDDSIKGGGSG